MMKIRILIGVLSMGLLLSSGGAIYYKLRATDYESRWTEAMGRLARTIGSPRPSRSATPEPSLPVLHSPTNSSAALEEEFQTLLLELEQKNGEIAQLQSRTNRTNRTRNFPSAEERQARMEEWKKENPDQYKEMMARREEMRNRIQTAFAERAVTLLDRASTNLSEEEQAQQDYMFQTLNETWQLTEKIAAADTPPDERREIGRELMEKNRELRPLLTDERNRQLYELGISSGYNKTESEEFVNYINETLQATSLPQSGRGGRRGR